MTGTNQRTSLRLASIFAVSLLLAAATPPAESPVADAAEKNDVQAVRSLLQQGADANAAQPDGLTALHWAALNDNKQIADLLLYAGATVRPLTRVGGYTPLHLAAQSGNAEIVGVLLTAGADPDALTGTGVTALHFAAQANSAATITTLAEHGAEVDAPDSYQGRTPLMFAASRNSTEAVRALLATGADPSVQTDLKDYKTVSEVDREEQNLRQRVNEARTGGGEGRGGRGGGPPGQPRSNCSRSASRSRLSTCAAPNAGRPV
jgi:ankyrin repeat protein